MLIDLSSNVWAYHGDFGALEVALNSVIARMKGSSDGIESSRRTEQSDKYQSVGRNAVISVKGPILRDGGFWAEYFGFASSMRVKAAVEEAAGNEDIERIILDINSPGGSVSGLADVSDSIRKAAEEKTVIAHVNGLAASAAYWIASNASEIYANRMDIIGSIGVRTVLIDSSKMADEAGIKVIPVDTGKFKSAGEPGTEITDEQIADFQRTVDAYFADFKETVISGRSMSEKQFEAVSDGRVWTAGEAVNLGLIDGIKSIKESFVSSNRSTDAARRRIAMMACKTG